VHLERAQGVQRSVCDLHGAVRPSHPDFLVGPIHISLFMGDLVALPKGLSYNAPP
jgi:hypothetical protein